MKTTQSFRYGLSKSRITSFEQCPKKLWLSVHRRDVAEYDAGAEARFASGNAVGDIASALHPSGVMVEAEPDLGAAVAETARLIAEGHPGPIFEATFEHDGVLVRVDVLERRKKGWHAAEVKSSTGVKDYHRGDLATQAWVLQACDLPLKSASVRHIDRDFELTREGNYAGLFADAELLRPLKTIIGGRAGVVAAAREVLAGEEPVVEIGEAHRNAAGLSVITVSHPGRQNWISPDSDPSDLIVRVLKGRSQQTQTTSKKSSASELPAVDLKIAHVDEDWRNEHLSRLHNGNGKAAYAAMREAESLGLTASPNTGAVAAVRLRERFGEADARRISDVVRHGDLHFLGPEIAAVRRNLHSITPKQPYLLRDDQWILQMVSDGPPNDILRSRTSDVLRGIDRFSPTCDPIS